MLEKKFVLLFFLSILDLAFTKIIVDHLGVDAELNPVMRHMITHDIWISLIFKLITLLFFACVIHLHIQNDNHLKKLNRALNFVLIIQGTIVLYSLFVMELL